jgi:hypothetical protein
MLTDSLGNIENRFERMKHDLPIKIANIGTNFFRRSFEHQGFEDHTQKDWQEVQRRIPGTLAYKYPKRNADTRHNRGILIGRGTLRAAVNNSNKSSEWDDISWEVDLPYAKAHNEGLIMHYGNKMPERKFIGRSEVLLKLFKEKIMSEMSKLHTK